MIEAKSVPDFIVYAKTNPGKINMTSAGSGWTSHMAGEMFKMMAGVDMVHVPYRGGGPAVMDLLGGQVQVMFATAPAAIEYIRAASFASWLLHRQGGWTHCRIFRPWQNFVPGYEATGWAGIGAPRDTPPEDIATLNREVNSGLLDPTFKTRIVDLGAETFRTSPADFSKFIAVEVTKWGKVVKFANIKPE